MHGTETEKVRAPVSILKRAGGVSRPKSVTFDSPVAWVPAIPRKNPKV